MTASNGCASGGFSDAFIKLSRQNSIVGRSVAIHGNSTDADVMVAQGVVGRADSVTTEDQQELVPDDQQRVIRAGCVFERTGVNLGPTMAGSMTFTDHRDGMGIEVKYFVYGLTEDSYHNFHVHHAGNISDTAAGMAVGGHWIGRCSPQNKCRSNDSVAQEVGMIGDGRHPMFVDNFIAQGGLTDKVISLHGINSIVGRSIIIHGNPDTALRYAQCVIGALEYENQVPAVWSSDPKSVAMTTGAAAVLSATTESPQPYTNINGYVRFDLVPGSLDMRIKYVIVGLPPGEHTWHVHSYGNLCKDDGQSVGGHFLGDCNATNPCRPSSSPKQEVGMINNGVAITANSEGVAVGTFVDKVMTFNGTDSILGRSIIVHGNGTTGNGIRVAQGVIGKTYELTAEKRVADVPDIYSASCRVVPTRENPDQSLDGYVTFEYDATAKSTLVKYTIKGLTPGFHGWHIHDFGDLVDRTDGHSVGGHFTGQPVGAGRPAGVLNEVGMLNDGEKIQADKFGVAFGIFRDTHIALNGNNSIIGRSIIIHGNGTDTTAGNAVRVAQCVVGTVSDKVAGTQSAVCQERMPEENFVREVRFATCQFHPTSKNADQTQAMGYMTFNVTGTGATQNVTVKWNVCKLSPGEHKFHVHAHGDVFSPDGSGATGHFIGECRDCRPSSSLAQEIGMIGNGAVKINAAGDGCASGELNDDVLQLNGINSILGRSVVIHGIAGDPAPYAATCVIGRGETEEQEAKNDPAPRMPLITRATCNFETTAKKLTTTDALAGGAGGYMTFELQNATDPDSKIEVRWSLWGFPGDGTAAWGMPMHVHQMGDISDTNAALKTGAHFNGSCSWCRPNGVTQEVGYIGDGFKIVPKDKVASGYLVDSVLKLNGPRSIIGRSIVLHGPKTTSDRIAQCVIGVSRETYQPPAMVAEGTVPFVTRLVGTLTPTTYNAAKTRGQVELDVDAATDKVRARFLVSGLTSGTKYNVSVAMFGNLCDDNSTGNVTWTLAGDVKANSDGVIQGLTWPWGLWPNATNQLLGRSVIVSESQYGKPALAQAALGRAKEEPNIYSLDAPFVGAASCLLEPTYAAPNQSLTGFISLKADQQAGSVRVEYEVSGLPPGMHTWHIHTAGDVSSRDNGAAATGHYIGRLLYDARPAGVAQEVGMINDGRPMIADSKGWAYGVFQDLNLRLTGDWSQIIGRSIVIHGDGTTSGAGKRIAQCTIGATTYEEVSPKHPPPACSRRYTFDRESAECLLEATTITEANPNLGGRVNFVKVNNKTVQVSFDVCNLAKTPGAEALHKWHIRKYGNIFMRDGTSLGDKYYSLAELAERQMNTSSFRVDGRNCTQYAFQIPYEESPLRGRKAVVGRSVSISAAGDENKIIGQCVVGRTNFHTLDEAYPVGHNRTRRTTCNFRSTAENVLSQYAGGYINFEENTPGTLDVRYFATNLPDGGHSFHVHVKGDVSQKQAFNVEGHFIGDCDNKCRPQGVIQEIGYLGDGYEMEGSNLVVRGWFQDTVATLDGPRSVVGRSVIIHGDGVVAAPRVAQCVIGITHDDEDVKSPDEPAGNKDMPQVTRAFCHLKGTGTGQRDKLLGFIDMELLPGAQGTHVKYTMTGMKPGTHSWDVREFGDQCDHGNSSRSMGNRKGAAWTDFVVDAHGAASGQFTSASGVKFYGTDSIIGRGIAVFGAQGTAEESSIVASCVVGVATLHPTQRQPDHYAAEWLSCAMEATEKNPLMVATASDPNPKMRGYVSMRRATVADDVTVEVHVPGLARPVQVIPPQDASVNDHTWHVHEWGDLMSLDTGMSTGNHFIGKHPFPAARPFKLDEIGAINDGAAFQTDRLGAYYATFVDNNMGGTKENNILGRSMVIHGDGTLEGKASRVAFCVVASASSTFGRCDKLLDYTPPPPLPSDGDEVSWTLVVGGIGGGVLLIAFAAAAVRAHRRKRAEKGHTPEHRPVQDEQPVSVELQTATATTMAQQQPQAAATTTSSAPVAVTGLPPGWQQHRDAQGNVYYWNSMTNASQWEWPTA
eukprot:TRINITY_DN66072_c7_g2_i1.p1 TRINITY_DN66072_c7_g2~~TRINITY_DN66072_c7_g2_i1.p1  ORF type:complete len:2196 (-),score=1193.92 TRINITY_DN66072_c7_g2_i1:2860-8910(-)